jgi:uroporphyrinogen-III decarboxylase
MINFFNKKELDRLPAIEWAPWWHLTLNRWRDEGLDDSKGYINIYKDLSIDPSLQLLIPNELPGCPSFKEHGFISNEAEYEQIRPYIFQKEIIYNMIDQIKNYSEDFNKNKDFISWITFSGFFWHPRVLFGIEDHLYSFYDYPELYHRICRDMVEYYKFALDEITKYITPNFMTFAEDMSYNLGPMLSEKCFNDFIKPYYEELIPCIHEKGIKLIIDSDGDVTKMIPWFISCGVDGILPLERQAGVDVCKLTEDYPDFYFIGGFDKMVMKNGISAMRYEFERILPAMEKGKYIASVDHQTPPDVSLENYRIYAQLLKEYCIKAVKR